MAGPGGYRVPANPAPVSGPGALSQRTDGRQPIMDLPNADYGQNSEFRTQQAGAALPQTAAPTPPPAGAPSPGPDIPPPAPLSGGSILPDQPVTAGADAGAGPGLSDLNLPDATQRQYETALDMVKTLAASPNASPALQYLAGAIQRGY
jgi:hypothetical protein